MPISSPTRTSTFIGNGVATNFTFTFKVFAKSDLLVVKSHEGTDTALVLDSDYSVTLTPTGGSVTLGAPLPAGDGLSVTSSVPATQELDLQNQGGFYPDTITKALDKLTILIQQLQDRFGSGVFVGNLLGTVDGANTVFTLTNNGIPLSSTPKQCTVWQNYPLVQGVGYVLGPDPGQVTFTIAPQVNDLLFAQGAY